MSAPGDIAPAQSAGTVLRAELGRQWSDRRRFVRLMLLTALSVLCGCAVLGFVHEFAPDGRGDVATTLPTAIELTASSAAILLGLHTLASVSAETNDGTVVTSLLLVPRRGRLLLMRATGTVIVAAAAGVAALVLVLGIGLVMTGAAAEPSTLAATLASGAGTIVLTCSLGFCTATAVRSGVAGMLAALLGLVVLPLSIGALQLAAPSSLSGILEMVMLATPGAGVLQSVTVQPPNPGAAPPALTGLMSLVAWNILTAFLAHFQFRREGRRA